MIVTPTTPPVPDGDRELALALEHAENDMNDALENGQFHRTYARYQHLKLLREERVWRGIGNFRTWIGW